MATPWPGGGIRCGTGDPARPQDTPPRIHLPGSGPEIRAYSQWVNGCICAELRRVREERGISAYALALPGILHKQTIANIESGTNSPSLVTLSIFTLRLGVALEVLVANAFRKDPGPGDG